MVSNISILGSTGSIGTQALEVVDKLGLRISALTANKNTELLEKQARKYNGKIHCHIHNSARCHLQGIAEHTLHHQKECGHGQENSFIGYHGLPPFCQEFFHLAGLMP